MEPEVSTAIGWKRWDWSRSTYLAIPLLLLLLLLLGCNRYVRCRLVWQSVTCLQPAKTTEGIEVLFVVESWWPKEHCIRCTPHIPCDHQITFLLVIITTNLLLEITVKKLGLCKVIMCIKWQEIILLCHNSHKVLCLVTCTRCGNSVHSGW